MAPRPAAAALAVHSRRAVLPGLGKPFVVVGRAHSSLVATALQARQRQRMWATCTASSSCGRRPPRSSWTCRFALVHWRCLRQLLLLAVAALLLLLPPSDATAESRRPCLLPEPALQARGGAPAAAASAGDDHKPRTPPPDLPSLLLDSRIVYLGMPVRLEPICSSAAPLHRVCMASALPLLCCQTAAVLLHVRRHARPLQR